MKNNKNKDPVDKYYNSLASNCRQTWSRSSPDRKEILFNSRSPNWTSKYKRHFCSECTNEFAYSDIEVDHVIAICKSSKVQDLDSFLRWVIALNSKNLQVLCKDCHHKKTKKDIKEKINVVSKRINKKMD